MSQNFTAMTVNGYHLDEVASALQKEIRRNKPVSAMFWARELIASGYWKYLLRRLEIIAFEDIGIANPMAAVYMNAASEIYAKHASEKSKGNPDGNIIAAPILYLCQSAKSRSGDNLWGTTDIFVNQGVIPPIPDYALDGHTQQGRQRLGKIGKENIVKWWMGSASLVTKEIYDPFFSRNLSYWLLERPYLSEDAKQMLKERFPEDFEVYQQMVKETLPVMKHLHKNHNKDSTDEEKAKAIQDLLSIQG